MHNKTRYSRIVLVLSNGIIFFRLLIFQDILKKFNDYVHIGRIYSSFKKPKEVEKQFISRNLI